MPPFERQTITSPRDYFNKLEDGPLYGPRIKASIQHDRMLQRFRNLRILPIGSRRCTHSNSDEGFKGFDREYVDMNIEDFRKLYENDGTKKDVIATILNEYEYMKYNSLGRVPTKIELKDMQLLIDEGPSPHQRSKIMHYLFKREMAKRNAELKKLKEKELTRARREIKIKEFSQRGASRTGLLDDQGELVYGLWHNSLFCRIPDNKLKGGASTSRLITAAMFGRKLIYDFGFEQYMTNHAIRNSIDQVQEAYGLNRFGYEEPLDLWFCNFHKNSYQAEYCSKKAITNLHDGSMITLKEDCFTNHFPKERLVYLSPDAKEPLGRIHKCDDIYIVGVYNDKGNNQPVSYRKALKLGIRTRCLPIDSHMVWQGAGKAICINQVTGIILEALSNGSDWGVAFEKYIPKRKIRPIELVIRDEQQRAARRKHRPPLRKFNLREDLDI